MSEDVGAAELGRRVRAARVAKRHKDGRKWSQSDLAQAVGASGVNAISELERGRRPRDPAFVARIATALGVSADWLLGRTENGGPSVSENVVVYYQSPAPRKPPPPELPQRARTLAYEFMAEAVKSGASEDDMAFIRRSLLEDPRWFAGGRTQSDTVQDMESLIVGLRVWLSERRRLRDDRTTSG